MKKISFTLLAFVAFFTATAQHSSTFEDLGLPPDSYWNGSDLSGGFLDGDAYFVNTYDTAFGGYWSGFAYSNQPVNVDTITNGSTDYSYQYNSAAGAGALGSATFGVCFVSGTPAIRLRGFAPGHAAEGMFVTNSAYDYLSMTYGDAFAKKFGGVTGMDSDWFRLTITGWYNGAPIADSVNFYLADFRSPNVADHYILHTWQFVNLISLGNVDSLTFILNSSDTTSGLGMNTPAYFDLDNFTTTDGAVYTPPVAVNDSFTVQYMDTLTGNADTLVANILVNDTFSVNTGFTVTLLTAPQIPGATAYLNSSDSLVYIPAEGIAGEDTLYYSLCDQFDSCSTALIFVTIIGPNNTGAGIVELQGPAMYVYPNPAGSRISVSSASLIQSLSVIDISGREVIQTDVNRNITSLDVSAFSPGIYTVLIHTTDGLAARRLVRQ
jgi:hypothetical protein